MPTNVLRIKQEESATTVTFFDAEGGEHDLSQHYQGLRPPVLPPGVGHTLAITVAGILCTVAIQAGEIGIDFNLAAEGTTAILAALHPE